MGSLAFAPASPDLHTAPPTAHASAAQRIKAAARVAWNRTKGAALRLLGAGRAALAALGALASMAAGYVQRRLRGTKKTTQDGALPATVEQHEARVENGSPPLGAFEPEPETSPKAAIDRPEAPEDTADAEAASLPEQNAPALGADCPFRMVPRAPARAAGSASGLAADRDGDCFEFPLAVAGSEARARTSDVF